MNCFNLFSSKPKLKIGDKAPDFKLLDSNNNEVSLNDFKGKKRVVYFYPKSNTTSCTKEACSFRDQFSKYKENDIVVFGISYDKPEILKKFKEKNHLPFILLSDHNTEIAKKYGAYKNIFNWFVPNRITFLINEQDRIIAILDNIDVNTHAADILKRFNIKIN